MTPTTDTIPVAKTPPGGWTEWPAPILAGCTEPRPDGVPDLDGFWRTIEVTVEGAVAPDHPSLGHVQRIEQRGDRVVVTGGSIVHDMRCDGTLERGVHDVAEFDHSVEIHVVASYEDGVHVLRPSDTTDLQGTRADRATFGRSPNSGSRPPAGTLRPSDTTIEIRRWRDGPYLIWDYLGFTARLEHLAPSDTDPADVPALRPNTESP